MSVTLETIITHMGAESSDIIGFIRVQVAGLLAFVFVVAAIFRLKAFAQAQNMMSSSQGEMKGVLIYLIIGAVLANFSLSQATLWRAIYETPGLLHWTGSGISDISQSTKNFIGSFFDVLEIFGYIAFLRGILIVGSLGKQGAPHGTLGKAVTHVVAGLMLINLPEAFQFFGTLFGFTVVGFS